MTALLPGNPDYECTHPPRLKKTKPMTEATEAMRIAGRDTANKGPRGQEAWADYAERIYLAMEAARTPAAPDDVERRLLSVAKTLETAGSQAFAIDFAQLAHDIRAALADHTTKDDLTEQGEK